MVLLLENIMWIILFDIKGNYDEEFQEDREVF